MTENPSEQELPVHLPESQIGYVFTTTPEQSAAIFARLRQEKGLRVFKYQGHPAFENIRDTRHVRKALRIVFSERMDGWWNLKRFMTDEGICTAEEFEAARPGKAAQRSPESPV